MNTPTNVTGLPPPEWIYDRFMSVIEPELTTARLPYLDAEYAGESSDHHADRMQRYADAFRSFADVLHQFGGYLYAQARDIQSHRRGDARDQEEGERAWRLKMADDLLGNATGTSQHAK